MKSLFYPLMAAAVLTIFQVTALAQLVLPYNPDGDSNGSIGSSDLQSILAVYGSAFEPGVILVDSVELSDYLNQLQGELALLQQQQASFQCGAKVLHEGYWYRTVQMGEDCWYAENVRHLPSVSPGNHESNYEEAHAYVWGYLGSDVDEAKSWMNYQLYGALYNYQAAVQWDLCPSGWHVPTLAEMTDLVESVNAVAGEANGASYFKQQIVNDSTQWEGTNMSGFSALPGGRRNFQTGFKHAGSKGYWMALGGSTPIRSLILDEAANAIISGEDVRRGVSLRCILNQE